MRYFVLDCCEGDFQDDGGSLWCDSVGIESLIWTGSGRGDIGYRDGLIAGKEAYAQEGFNVGFKQSVLVGYNWGAVRGVTSVLTFLPDDLKEKLIETQEKRKKNQGLYESVYTISTVYALIFFRDDIMRKKLMEQTEPVKKSSDVARMNRMIDHAAVILKFMLESFNHFLTLLRSSYIYQ
ncbi:PROTEIN YAE1-like protein [Salix purpurea]|uniref:PROTEIN YAE1-like protein n=1 Tax=Salix purpurea TaxID=77065 RepID=A0A9Q0QED1_SALPP|nr:PROTEIN YAE1-like protein [Salix purpurea]